MKVLLLFLLFWLPFLKEKPKPTLYLIGDSTVKTGKGLGENNQWGWGSVISEHFDTTKIQIENHAIGGRSSRTFLTDGRWDIILSQIKKDDFVLVQFGHNDDWAINDSLRARGTIKGIGDETQEIDNVITKKHEIVHTYGWYMRKYVNDTKAKGAVTIICSRVPQNNFEEGKVKRIKEYYPKWAKEVAKQTDAFYIDLHELTALEYDKLGTEVVKIRYFTPKDNTHTNLEGAKLNAQKVIFGIKNLRKCKLREFLVH